MSTDAMGKTVPASTAPGRSVTAGALGILLLRLILVAAASVLTWTIVGVTVGWVAFPPPPMLAAVAMLPVNLVCLALVRRRLRREGRSIGELIGLRPGRIAADALWGLLWLFVLYVPFVLTIMGVMWALHGADMFARFETVFFDPAAIPPLAPAVSLTVAIITVVTFAPLNAPVEELVYRGYAQDALAKRWPAPLAILISAIVFGAQHILYAPTPDAMLVYACAFFVWGVGSGIIVRRQKRLLPIVIAHFLINLATTVPAVFVPFLT